MQQEVFALAGRDIFVGVGGEPGVDQRLQTTASPPIDSLQDYVRVPEVLTYGARGRIIVA